MKIIITGGQGFLGQRLATALLQQTDIHIKELILADIHEPTIPNRDSRVRSVKMDFRHAHGLADIVTRETDAIFHLAAIVSSHAEENPELGYETNVLVTKNLLDICRKANPNIRFIFSSSLAVYGGKLPDIITHHTVATPLSSYGTQKSMCELLINDYSRKGFVDGIALRLPTICIRSGTPNKAASSFVSSIIREPLNGEKAICPVSKALHLWVSSPDTVVRNFIHALTLPSLSAKAWHAINLPGLTVSIKSMLQDLATIKGDTILEKIEFKFDEKINDIVASWPTRIDCSQASKLGFYVDNNFRDVINQFIQRDL